MSEPTSTLSSLVRYTAVFIAMTFGSCTAACAKTSKLARNDSYGWWTSDVAAADLVEDPRERRLCAAARRGGIAGTHGSYFRSGRSSAVELQELGEVERALDAVDLRLVGVRARASSRVDHLGRGGRAHLDADDVAEAALAKLALDGLEQVGGVVRDLEVGVARDAEHRALDDRRRRGRASGGSAR